MPGTAQQQSPAPSGPAAPFQAAPAPAPGSGSTPADLGAPLGSYGTARWGALQVVNHVFLALVATAMVVTIPFAVWLVRALLRSPNFSAATRAKRVEVYERGVVLLDRDGQDAVFRFDSLALRSSILVKRVYGIRLDARHAHTLTDASGRTRVLTELYEGIDVLARQLQEGVARAQLAGVLAAVRSGQEVSFGPIAVRPDGIVTPRGLLAWDALHRMDIVNGEIQIRAHGKRLLFASVKASAVLNRQCMLAAIGRLRPPRG